MLGSIYSKEAARKSTSTVRRNRFRPQCEVVENRLLMTGPGITISPHLPFCSLRPSQLVNLTTEPHDQVAGILTGKTTQYYSFQLQDGDYLRSDLDVESGPGAHVSSQMSILNAKGAILGTSAPGTPYGFYAAASGTYWPRSAEPSPGRFLLLRINSICTAWPSPKGRKTSPSWPRPGRCTRGSRAIRSTSTGPTGYGFGITGNWKETTTRNRSMSRSPPPTPPPGRWTANRRRRSAADRCGQFGSDREHGRPDQRAACSARCRASICRSRSTRAAWCRRSPDTFGFNLNPIAENVTVDITMGGAAGVGLGDRASLRPRKHRLTMPSRISASRSIHSARALTNVVGASSIRPTRHCSWTARRWDGDTSGTGQRQRHRLFQPGLDSLQPRGCPLAIRRPDEQRRPGAARLRGHDGHHRHSFQRSMATSHSTSIRTTPAKSSGAST